MPNIHDQEFNSVGQAGSGAYALGPSVTDTAAMYKTISRRSVFDENAPRELKKGFKLGADPEGFIFNKKTGKPVPAHLFIPGSKWKPHPVDNGAVQVDGFAAEFNIDPAETYEEFEGNISSVISQLEGFIDKKHELRFVASVTFDEEDFAEAPDENKELGCQPDFDAWSGGVNPPPRPENPLVRVAGGHLHFGWTDKEDLNDLQHLLNCQDLGKQADWFLGAWGAVTDTDTVRPPLYGKSGAIRYKPYGVEYRTLSNFWVATPELRKHAWNRSCAAVEFMHEIYFPDRVNSFMNQTLKNAIATHTGISDLMVNAKFPVLTLNRNQNRW